MSSKTDRSRARTTSKTMSKKGPSAGSTGKGVKRSRKDAELLRWGGKGEDEVSSSDEDRKGKKRSAATLNGGDREGSDSDSDEKEREAKETAQEKRIRLAKDYLLTLGEDEIENGRRDSDEDSESEGEDGVINRGVSEDKLARRLERERLAARGQLQRALADGLVGCQWGVEGGLEAPKCYSGHKLAATCVALSSDDRSAFTGSKDNSILKWDVETGEKTLICPRWKPKGADGNRNKVNAHHGEILAVATSSDGRYLAGGGRDKAVRIWDLRAPMPSSPCEELTGHRDAVTGLAFRVGPVGASSLFSASNDRCLKHWGIGEVGYIETLFGHQSPALAVDALRKERCVSGGADGTARAWKVAEEAHSVFKCQGGGSIDAVACIDDEWFLSGGSDGALSLWNPLRKRAVDTVLAAHGSGTSGVPRWICSIAAAHNSDIAMSGSNDGVVRVWRVEMEASKGALEEIASVPVAGFVNGLRVATSARFAVAAIGQEHRLGRWEKISNAINGICVIPLPEPKNGEGS